MRKIIIIFKIILISILSFLLSSSIYSDTRSRRYDFSNFEYLALTPEILALGDRIDNVLEEYDSFDYQYALKIVSLDIPQVFYDLNSHNSFIPASNLKVITTAVAFSTLTPYFRWKTEFFLNDFGDLYIRASGDPTWNNSFRTNMLNYIMTSVSDSLKAHRFTQVNNIIVDPGSFMDHDIGNGWRAENRLFAFSALPSPLAFNDNNVQIQINPSRVGSPARITLYPANSGFTVINNVTTVSQRNRQNFDFATEIHNNTVTVRGNIWDRSRTQYRSVAVPKPDIYSLHVLKEKLIENGINIRGNIYNYSMTGRDIIVNRYNESFSIFSEPLYEVVNEINKSSNNFMSNQLFLTLAEQSWDNIHPETIIKNWLVTNNVITDSLSMSDGSGLSPLNRTTTDTLVSVLRIMSNSDYADEFLSSMAISGIDGTLRNTFTSESLYGRVYAKTGYILGARALTGYIATADNERLAFSFIINKNDSTISNYYEIAEKVLTELALFTRNPQP